MGHPSRPTSAGANLQAVTFDVGGTLIKPHPSVGHVYAAVAARHGLNAAPDLLNEGFAAAWKAKQCFNHTREDWAGLVERTFAAHGQAGASSLFFNELYDRFAEPDAWHLFEDVFPVVHALREKKIRLAIISNWDERLRKLLTALNLDSYFDPIIISCEVNAPKPSGRIFEAAATKLGLPPADILHVGDSWEEDIHGAKQAGFQAAWLRRKEASLPGGEFITSLIELIGLVEKRSRTSFSPKD